MRVKEKLVSRKMSSKVAVRALWALISRAEPTDFRNDKNNTALI